MFGLPRRWVRQLGYVFIFIVISVVLLLIANSQNIIKLQDYLPESLTPSFFQPVADSYVIDVSINNCYSYKSNQESCGKPLAWTGELGDLRTAGEWVKVEKDLSLGSSWFRQQYFSYKKLNSDASDSEILASKGHKDSDEKVNRRVIVDIAIANPQKDAKIKGNEKSKIPIHILEEFHAQNVFDDVDHARLQELGKEYHGEKTNAVTEDQDNIASKKINDMNTKLEQEEENKANEKLADDAKVKGDGKAEAKEFEEDIPPQDPDPSDGKKGNKAIPEQEASPEDAEKAGKEESNAAKEIEEFKAKANKENPQLGKSKKPMESEDSEEVSPEEQPKEKVEDTILEKREVAQSRQELDRVMIIPTKDELKKRGWEYKSHGIWVKYGPVNNIKAITGIDLLFGEDAVEPRPNWKLIKDPLTGVATQPDKPAYLTFRRGTKEDYKDKKYQPILKINQNGKFKILQVADLHFSTGVGKCRDPFPASTAKGCQADPRTLKFLERVLDIEKPDLVVLTGDQVFGDAAPDAETALFKALNPFVQRKIPFAVTLGNHDDEGSLSRKEIMGLSANLPYSMAALGADEVEGYGNYLVTVEGPSSRNLALSLYFLDSHKYSKNPKVTPGYDWLKESQLLWVEQAAASIEKAVASYSKIHLSMAFFHIPLPEYRNLQQPYIGDKKEGVTAPRYNSGGRSVFSEVGVKVVSVGHDHCNDYCLQDTQDKDGLTENKMWLCYGGGSGEGGYGGYGGYVRRFRVFDIDTANGEIKTWKRAENNPDSVLDHQTIVQGGKVVNFA
ncbi:Metallo-dependent phosphatase-like protein [Scheffersomyces xylosifermentans]|uniref:Metallo-dependent phosphatase-like protein n=1 Tax=Scheffersomyces xylosifermentans TaxID=1304137 RepID=UPI00315CC081